ncbi:hypothetical protein Daesc_009781 [Daldinia eschscholtzii]|uniref:Uncharacterized protein n=1 Tax=Daldinia eschscholtzii TaxID=292717 RepID=A0AAX6MBD8_9PEZI
MGIFAKFAAALVAIPSPVLGERTNACEIATLVPTYFENVFSYSGDSRSLQGFLDAIVLVMETGFAVTAFVCIILNLALEEEIEETDEKLVATDEPVMSKGMAANRQSIDSSRNTSGREKRDD